MTGKGLFDENQLSALLELTRRAGTLIMRYYKKNHAVDRKDDASPVTIADREADRMIVQGLAELAPDIPAVSEEGAKPDVSDAPYFWLIDPLDGTKSFIRGRGYFTVNIGLIGPERTPVFGSVYDPVNRILYWGQGNRAFRQTDKETPKTLYVRPRPAQGLTAIISHSHLDPKTEAWLATQHIRERLPCASSIKFCRLAEGSADVYPRFGPTMEWDTAAGHAVLMAAGGFISLPDGSPFLYNKNEFKNGHFIAWGRS